MSKRATAPVALSDKDAAGIVELMRGALQAGMKPDERITLTGELVDEHLCFMFELATPKRDEVFKLECAVPIDKPDDKSLAAARGILTEFMHYSVGVWLTEGRIDPPNLDWKKQEYEGVEVLVRGSLVNEELERLADQWLEAAERGEEPPGAGGP